MLDTLFLFKELFKCLDEIGISQLCKGKHEFNLMNIQLFFITPTIINRCILTRLIIIHK
jgi:hypothetical protein